MTARGVNAWQVAFDCVYVAALGVVLVGMLKAADVVSATTASLVVLGLDLVATVASLIWAVPAVIAMYHTDLATSGALYADQTK